MTDDAIMAMLERVKGVSIGCYLAAANQWFVTSQNEEGKPFDMTAIITADEARAIKRTEQLRIVREFFSRMKGDV